MITLAEVYTGTITEIISVADTIAAMSYRRGWVEITGISPAPQVGWTWDRTTHHEVAPVHLGSLRVERCAALRATCAASIVGGFQSAALGALHSYPSTETDQVNVGTSATVANSNPGSEWTAPLWCADANGAWTFATHTAAQVQEVMADWIAYRAGRQARLVACVADIATASDPAAIAAVAF